jgi:hypothetical protein
MKKIKGWALTEKDGLKNVTKRESAYGSEKGIVQRYDKKK